MNDVMLLYVGILISNTLFLTRMDLDYRVWIVN